jgi:hypothetical protein
MTRPGSGVGWEFTKGHIGSWDTRRRRHWSYSVIARTGRGEREYTTMAAGLAVDVIRKLKKFGEAERGDFAKTWLNQSTSGKKRKNFDISKHRGFGQAGQGEDIVLTANGSWM